MIVHNLNIIVQIMIITQNSQDKLEILRKLSLRPKYSQRQLAKVLVSSLGKLNNCLRASKIKV